jgi:hypothetical protein
VVIGMLEREFWMIPIRLIAATPEEEGEAE